MRLRIIVIQIHVKMEEHAKMALKLLPVIVQLDLWERSAQPQIIVIRIHAKMEQPVRMWQMRQFAIVPLDLLERPVKR